MKICYLNKHDCMNMSYMNENGLPLIFLFHLSINLYGTLAVLFELNSTIISHVLKFCGKIF